jgi:hypothetical protein
VVPPALGKVGQLKTTVRVDSHLFFCPRKRFVIRG